MIDFYNGFIDGFWSVWYTEWFQILFRIIAIIVLSGFIGLERASQSKPAGFRTHVLVGVSAVLVMLCGTYLHLEYGSDVTRIPAQLLSGIGFLGAGTILRDGFNVRGLTTAASLLIVTCIGLCIGAGFYAAGFFATLFAYFILRKSQLISDKVEHYNDFKLELEVEEPREILQELQKIVQTYKIEVTTMNIVDDAEIKTLKITGKYRDAIEKNKLILKLLSIKQIKQVVEI